MERERRGEGRGEHSRAEERRGERKRKKILK